MVTGSDTRPPDFHLAMEEERAKTTTIAKQFAGMVTNVWTAGQTAGCNLFFFQACVVIFALFYGFLFPIKSPCLISSVNKTNPFDKINSFNPRQH